MSKRARSKLKRKVTKSDPKPSENDNQERPMENGEGEMPKAIGNTEGQELNDKLLKLCKPFVIRVRKLNANSLKRLMNDGDSKRKPSKENKTAEKNETTEHTEKLTDRKRSRKNSKGIKPTTRRSKTRRKTASSTVISQPTWKSPRKCEELYNFSIQSQNSLHEAADPAADIIQKLIQEGRVRVVKQATTNKRKRKAHVTNKDALTNDAKLAHKKNGGLKTKMITASSLQKDIQNKANDNNVPVNNVNDALIGNKQPQPKQLKRKICAKTKSPVHSAGDVFSRLAQSVLVRETMGKSTGLARRMHSKELLEKVRKIVNTSEKGVSEAEDDIFADTDTIERNISPIPSEEIAIIGDNEQSRVNKGFKQPLLNSTPWRLDQSSALPTLFCFSRNSKCLPSYSSDFLMSTPRKLSRQLHPRYSKRNSGSVLTSFSSCRDQEAPEVLDSRGTVSDACSTSVGENRPLTTDSRHDGEKSARNNSLPSILPPVQSSMTMNDSDIEDIPRIPASHGISRLNDSNAENIPPKSFNCDENISKVPLPRLGQQHSTPRQPLRTLNILEVINLPPYKTPATPIASSTQAKNINNYKKDTRKTKDPQNTQRPRKTLSSQLYGFEEYLESADDSNPSAESTILSSNSAMMEDMDQSIEEKLNALRKWRPDTVLNNLRTTSNSITGQTKETNLDVYLFNHRPHKRDPFQQDIKNMLCSTMIQANRNNQSGKDVEQGSASLFKDNEAEKEGDEECSFNVKDNNRTYERPYKRKRRVYERKFVMMIDSDASSDDDDEGDSNKKKSKGSSIEEDVCHETKKKNHPNAKRPRRGNGGAATAENPQLDLFVREFNAMCKDVDEYEMQIE